MAVKEKPLQYTTRTDQFRAKFAHYWAVNKDDLEKSLGVEDISFAPPNIIISGTTDAQEYASKILDQLELNAQNNNTPLTTQNINFAKELEQNGENLTIEYKHPETGQTIRTAFRKGYSFGDKSAWAKVFRSLADIKIVNYEEGDHNVIKLEPIDNPNDSSSKKQLARRLEETSEYIFDRVILNKVRSRDFQAHNLETELLKILSTKKVLPETAKKITKKSQRSSNRKVKQKKEEKKPSIRILRGVNLEPASDKGKEIPLGKYTPKQLQELCSLLEERYNVSAKLLDKDSQVTIAIYATNTTTDAQTALSKLTTFLQSGQAVTRGSFIEHISPKNDLKNQYGFHKEYAYSGYIPLPKHFLQEFLSLVLEKKQKAEFWYDQDTGNYHLFAESEAAQKRVDDNISKILINYAKEEREFMREQALSMAYKYLDQADSEYRGREVRDNKVKSKKKFRTPSGETPPLEHYENLKRDIEKAKNDLENTKRKLEESAGDGPLTASKKKKIAQQQQKVVSLPKEIEKLEDELTKAEKEAQTAHKLVEARQQIVDKVKGLISDADAQLKLTPTKFAAEEKALHDEIITYIGFIQDSELAHNRLEQINELPAQLARFWKSNSANLDNNFENALDFIENNPHHREILKLEGKLKDVTTAQAEKELQSQIHDVKKKALLELFEPDIKQAQKLAKLSTVTDPQTLANGLKELNEIFFSLQDTYEKVTERKLATGTKLSPEKARGLIEIKTYKADIAKYITSISGNDAYSLANTNERKTSQDKAGENYKNKMQIAQEERMTEVEARLHAIETKIKSITSSAKHSEHIFIAQESDKQRKTQKFAQSFLKDFFIRNDALLILAPFVEHLDTAVEAFELPTGGYGFKLHTRNKTEVQNKRNYAIAMQTLSEVIDLFDRSPDQITPDLVQSIVTQKLSALNNNKSRTTNKFRQQLLEFESDAIYDFLVYNNPNEADKVRERRLALLKIFENNAKLKKLGFGVRIEPTVFESGKKGVRVLGPEQDSKNKKTSEKIINVGFRLKLALQAWDVKIQNETSLAKRSLDSVINTDFIAGLLNSETNAGNIVNVGSGSSVGNSQKGTKSRRSVVAEAFDIPKSMLGKYSKADLGEGASDPRRDRNPIDVSENEIKNNVLIPQSKSQQDMLDALEEFDFVHVQGPAATGKTYLAIAYGVHLLITGKVDKIVLARPNVEAGEKTGTLPGGADEKLAPFLVPLMDALEDRLSKNKIGQLRNPQNPRIEIVPIGYMRGRSYQNTLVIIDEAQNLTYEQYKMAVTRTGFGSRFIAVGDPDQCDLDLAEGQKPALAMMNDIVKHGFDNEINTDQHHIVKMDPKDATLRHDGVAQFLSATKAFDEARLAMIATPESLTELLESASKNDFNRELAKMMMSKLLENYTDDQLREALPRLLGNVDATSQNSPSP